MLPHTSRGASGIYTSSKSIYPRFIGECHDSTDFTRFSQPHPPLVSIFHEVRSLTKPKQSKNCIRLLINEKGLGTGGCSKKIYKPR